MRNDIVDEAEFLEADQFKARHFKNSFFELVYVFEVPTFRSSMMSATTALLD
jgi:hypothetical protein